MKLVYCPLLGIWSLEFTIHRKEMVADCSGFYEPNVLDEKVKKKGKKKVYHECFWSMARVGT